MRSVLLLAAALLAAALLYGCATTEVYEGEVVPARIYAANYRAADALIAAAGAELDADKPILMATLVDIDDLERSSTLGRMLSESISARFVQSRYRMVEMKFQNAVYMKRHEGEFVLTRQIREVAASHQAQAVVLGTYSRGNSTVFVNVKVVKPESNIVIAAQDYSLPISRNVCMLLYRDARACAELRN